MEKEKSKIVYYSMCCDFPVEILYKKHLSQKSGFKCKKCGKKCHIDVDQALNDTIEYYESKTTH